MRMPRLKVSATKARERLAAGWRIVAARIGRKKRGPRPRPAKIMKPYIDRGAFRYRLVKFFFPLALGFFCLLYGFFYGLTTPYLLVPFAFPVGILMLLAIWALPDRPHAPTKAMEFFFSGLLISLIIWPNYLALALPGLPWITVIRLTGLPMAFLLLICLSTSSNFRSELRQALAATPGVWVAFVTFIVTQFLTIGLSKHIPTSIQKALLQQVNWTAVFIVAVWVFRKPGRAERYISLFLLLSLPVILVTFLESRQQSLLWSGHVPSFLKIDDPAAAAAMQSTTRGATGQYRAKATFSGPLGLGEYLALMTPFAIHFAVGAYRPIIRLGCAVLVPLIFACFIFADSRLGIVGFLVSVLLYVLFWGLMKMFQERRSLVAAAVVYAYPALFGAALLAVTFVHRFHTLVFGGGAQAASNAARQSQLQMAIPKFLQNPIGYGPSESGIAMGYSADSFITVDNYYITLALEYGLVGIVSFLLTFGLAISFGARAAMTPTALRDRELSLLAPLSIALTAFLVIKAVFSQQDSHSLMFAMLGILVALIYRVSAAERQDPRSAAQPAAKVAAPTARAASGRRVPATASQTRFAPRR